MKPRLPHRLIQVLLTTSAAALSSTPSFGDVPEGYTPVTITGASQLSSYKKTDYRAFLIGVDITDSAYRMTGQHQYWSSDTPDSLVKISFANLSTSSKAGAAISAAKALTMEEFKSLTFSKNYNKAKGTYSYEPSAYGGAIYGSSSSTISISNSGSLDFSGNYAYSTASYASSNLAYSYGGAIYIGASSTLTMSNSESLSFNGNYVFSAPASTSSAYSYGGAICGEKSSTIAIVNNGNVSFVENYASAAGAAATSSSSSYSYGGAIYTTGSLFITGNGKVTFRGNYERDQGGTYCLRSVYVTGSTLNLAAGEGQNITFYDTLRGGTTTVSFNADYVDKGNVLQKATGDILFSGAHAADDLTALKANYTQEELTDSLTTRVSATTNLYGGRLRVEDGAIYKGNGINVAAGSGATLRLDNGTLNQAGYSVEMNAATTLDLQRVNSIAATTLDMKDGSALSFTLGEENLTSAALTLTGALNQGGALTIGLADDGTMEHENKYALLTMSSGTTPETWDITKLTVEGLVAKASNLSWENGTLYYTYAIPELETATWSGGQSRAWNTTDKNWTQGEYSYAYKDGVDVVFGDTGSGSVTLDGTLAPKSVLVENTAGHDYTWEGSGKLAGNATLTKNGEGKLTINTANDYTGGTVLNGGTLVAGSGTAFGEGAIQISNGTLDLGGNSLANDISALNADTIVRNGSLTGDFTMSGGSLDASELHIETQALSVTNAGEVSFRNANSTSDGGALSGKSGSAISLKGNKTVTFSENTAGYGGAIYAISSNVCFAENGTVTFSGNSTKSSYYDGGAIYGSSSVISFVGNESVTFSENSTVAQSVSWGGAICAWNSSSIKLENNGSVTFSGNSAFSGGAIYTSGGSHDLTGNQHVEFSGNSARHGGAIYTSGTINIQGNDSVTFRGNYEKTESGDSSTYRLRSVYVYKGSLNLAAGVNQDIVFYDSLYADSASSLSFNETYVDKNGVDQVATGDIVLSGKFAETDLRKLKPYYTQQELVDSLTSEVECSSNLYGGRLRIEDGAIYKGNGINVAAGSNATLRLAGGTLDQTGYDVLLNAGTTLDLEGANSITASTLVMMDGSTLSFNAGATEGVMLNLDAALKTGDLHVTVSGDLTKEYALLQLADVSQYDFTQWNSGQVNVTGTDFEHLIWKDGVLTYKPWESTHTDLDKDTEVDDFGGEEGVEIGGHGHSLTVKHPVDLVHLAMENGVVRLEGEDNNVVRITLTEDGTLQLAAGAGLNVGNIVSMVANGSADLEIAGDIEISDIKAYGRPGNKGTLSYVNMTTAGDYTIENMTITGSVIDVGEGTTLYLVNVDIKSDTHITDDPARVFAQSAHVELNGTNTWVDQEITAAQDTLLYMCGDTQRSITLAAGSEIVELTSSMFDSVTLTGTDLWLDMTGIADATSGKDYFTLDFQDLARKMAKAQVDVENLHVYATLDGEKYTEAYSTANGGLTTTLYFQVPEPTTSTLSLLALAALAARRKKK